MSFDLRYALNNFYDPWEERYFDESDDSLDESYGRKSALPPPLVEQVPLGAYVTNPGNVVPLYLVSNPPDSTICSQKDRTLFRQVHAYNKTPGFVVPFLCNAESKGRSGNFVRVRCRYSALPPWTQVVMRRPINPGIDTGVGLTIPTTANVAFDLIYTHPDFDALIQSLPDGVNMINFYIASVGTNTTRWDMYIDLVETYLPVSIAVTYTPVEQLTYQGVSPVLTAWGGSFGVFTYPNCGVYTANVPSPNLYVNHGPIPFFHGSLRCYKNPGFVSYKDFSIWIYDGSSNNLGTIAYGGGEAKDTFTFTCAAANGILAGVYTLGYTPVFA